MLNTSTLAKSNLFNSVANTTTRSVTNAVNSMNDFAAESTSTIASAANSAFNSLGETTTTLGTALNSAVNSAVNAVGNAATTTLNSIPMMNSMIPMGNNKKANNGKANNGGILNNSYFNNSRPNNNSAANNTRTNNSQANASAANNSGSSWLTSYTSLFLLLVTLSFLLFTAFSNEISLAYKNIVMSVRSALGLPATDVREEDESKNNVVVAPESIEEQIAAPAAKQSILQKLLPMSSPEVFNVNVNDYSYYDAEPMCRALGAELATYDQVKDAWTKGADWCNYGWVKGQVAVYPTQEETYDKLQRGPIDERGACGNPGVNGGYFDNPEMKFGVNCYGPKPDQSAVDEAALMKKGSIPKTPATLKVDQKTREFKDNLSVTTVAPFNTEKWAAS